MKSREFIVTIDKLEPSEGLINNTIRRVKKIEEEKGGIKMKGKVLKFVRNFSVGVAAMLILSATSFACYVGVTGNTEILEKIGIKLSKNYNDNAEEIDSIVQSNENSEIKIISAAIDKSYLVIEYDLKLAHKVQCENAQIESIIKFYDTNAKKYVRIIGETSQVSKKQEDGSFVIYQIILPKEMEGQVDSGDGIDVGDIRPYEHDLIAHVFEAYYKGGNEYYKSENAKFSVDLLSIKNENGKTIEDIKNNGAFEFELHQKDRIKEGKVQEIEKTYRNIKMEARIEKQPFATIATITAFEIDKNGEDVRSYIEKGTRKRIRELTNGEKISEFENPYNIENIDIVIKDQNGRVIKELSHYEYTESLFEADHFTRVVLLDEENDDVTEYKVELVQRQTKQREMMIIWDQNE